MKRQACSKDKHPEKQDKHFHKASKKRRPESLRMHPLFFRGLYGFIGGWEQTSIRRSARGRPIFRYPSPLDHRLPSYPLPRCQGPPRRTAARRSPPDLIAPRPAAAPLCHSSATVPPENRIESTKIFNSILNSSSPPPGSPQQLAAAARPVSPGLRAPSADRRASTGPAPSHPRLLNVRAPYFYR